MTSLNISLSHQTPWPTLRRSMPASAAASGPVTAPVAQAEAEPWAWPLAAGQVLRLRAAPRARWLRLRSGRLWLTRTGAGLAGGDTWLLPEQGLLLPAGSDWVVEAIEAAQACVLEAPQASALG